MLARGTATKRATKRAESSRPFSKQGDMAPLTIRIELYADTTCPWCYIGQAVLDRAMETYRARHPGILFELSWNPFYLFPDDEASGE